eukprot:403371091
MSLFQEFDVGQQNQVANTNFRQVRLIPISDTCSRVDIKNDWFNHMDYLNSTEKRLKTIKAPKISIQGGVAHQEVIDLDNPALISQRDAVRESLRDSSQSNASQKQSLIPKKTVTIFRPIKLEVKEFQNPKQVTPDELLKFLPDIDNFLSTRISQDSQEHQKSLELYSRNDIRNKLQQGLTEAQSVSDFSDKFDKVNIFKHLNQPNIFHHEGSLEFAQIHSQLPFIVQSNLKKDAYFSLLVNDSAKINQAAEFILFNLIMRQEQDPEYPCLYTLSLDANNESKEIQFGSALGALQSLDKEKVMVNLHKEIDDLGSIQNQQITLKQMEKIVALIEEETEFGVMLYFGGLDDNAIDERNYRLQTLQHTILALKTLQAKGSLILELKESFTNFTVSFIYLLSNIFNNVLLIKPYNSSPLINTQYLVCTDIAKAKPGKIINYLQNLYDKLTAQIQREGKLNYQFGDLINQKILADEDRFLNYLVKSNEAIAIYRQQYLKKILEDSEISDKFIQEFKQEYQKKWDLTGENISGSKQRNKGNDILDREIPLLPHQTQAYQGNKSVWNPRQTQKYNQGHHQGGGNYNKSGGKPPFNPPDNVIVPNEDELARSKVRADLASEDILQTIVGDREVQRRKQDEERRRKELRMRQAQKEQKEREEKERQIQALKDKLNKNGRKDDKKYKQESSSSGQPSRRSEEEKRRSSELDGSSAQINGDRISIPLASGSQNKIKIAKEPDDSDFQDLMRRRDQKAHDKSRQHQPQQDNKIKISIQKDDQNLGITSSKDNVNSKIEIKEETSSLPQKRMRHHDQHEDDDSEIKHRKRGNFTHSNLDDDYDQKSSRQNDSVHLSVPLRNQQPKNETKMEVDQGNNQARDEEAQKRQLEMQRRIEENRKKAEEEKQKALAGNPNLLSMLSKYKANPKPEQNQAE